ncbi:hypothetical protein HZC34_04065 [Candidatus Saganbacteria bacterium]|nr:hypothetical protein [Candidatus Saganbacteria bacterium]
MVLIGTEAEVVNVITKLNGASKSEINQEISLTLDYIGYICSYLVRKGHLIYFSGRYYPAGTPLELLPKRQPKVDKSFASEIADEVAKRIGISRGERLEERREERVKIKTDFDVPIKDESVGLESNINKVGAKPEKEKDDIDELIESLTRVRKGGR